MLYHNLLLFYRNIQRHRNTFFINLVGLSGGLACTLLIYLWVHDEWSTDKFHEKSGQLYQVMANHHDSERIKTLRETPDLLAETLAAEMPEVELATSYLPAELIPMKFILSAREDSKVKAAGQFADKDFFNVLSYPLVQGRPEQVLQDPNAIVLSEQLAKTMFESAENAVGKPLRWQVADLSRSAVVTGVFKDVPANSSNQFDFLLTIQAFRDPNLFHRPIHWDNHAPSTFVVLKKNTDVAAFNRKIEGFIQLKLASSKAELFIVPYADNYLYNKYENGQQAGGRILYVRLFSLIALFILLIACINFMNLATAKTSLRLKEVGIKKAVGISRKNLILQFMGESLGMSMLSLLVATALVWLLLPQFNTLTGKTLDLQGHVGWIPPFLGIAFATGLVSGSYPALYLSGFKPTAILKGNMSRNAGELWVRKGLVVVQFTLSTVFIIAVAVIYQQIRLVQTKNLGYSRDHVIQFGREGKLGEGLDVFLAEVKKIAGVVRATGIQGGFLGDNSYTTGVDWPGKQADETVTFTNLSGHYDLIETLDIQMTEGRSFSKDFGADSSAIIFNEAAIAAMHLRDPIGKTVKLWGEERKIIGVVRDFHLKSLREAIQPALFRLAPKYISGVMVKIKAGEETATIDGIRQFYARFNPGYTFDYTFLDDDFQKQYSAEMRVSALSKYFSGLAVLLSCLGLFGLAAFASERRTKEIGIRKVLGASVAGITGLLAKDFLKLVVLAIIIASPVAYWAMNRWLAGFAYHIDIQWWIFAVAGLAALAVAFLTVGFQSAKAALANPVKSLRSE